MCLCMLICVLLRCLCAHVHVYGRFHLGYRKVTISRLKLAFFIDHLKLSNKNVGL